MALPAPSAVAELLKPITWFPPMWAFGCGVVASGQPLEGRGWLILGGVLLAGPAVCATSQAVNDWFDRHVDAINEPQRPIPSGRMPGRWGLYVALLWTALSLALATALGPWGFGAAVVGLILAWAYSAPPLRLKRNGWWGNAACGISYEGLAWVTGAAVMAGGAMPDLRSLILAALYSAGAHGIMTLNDFKSIEGDRAWALLRCRCNWGRVAPPSPPRARWLWHRCWWCCCLLDWGRPAYAAACGCHAGGAVVWMSVRFVAAPVQKALWFSGLGVTLYVIGMLDQRFRTAGLA
jgi:chlorophyll synthase